MELYAVRIFVRDWPVACDFYGNILGLHETFRDDTVGWAEYDVGGPRLGIEQVTPEDTDGDELVGRFVGVSLRVDDIAATCRSLEARGVTFIRLPEQQRWGGWLAHFSDPEGNILTLLG